MSYRDFNIIDAHCHIFPDKIAEIAVKNTDNFYGLKALYKGTYSDLIERAAFGIDKFIVQSVATTPMQVSAINNFIAKSVSENKDKFIGLGTLHPESENKERDFHEILELGLNGVKLHPDIQRFAVDSDKITEIYKLCAKYKLPLLIHTGDSRYDYSNPDRMKTVLESFPEITVVGAHFGGWSVWDKACEMLCKYDNFYVDTSSSFYALTKEKVLNLIEVYGYEKILFGSDYPMWDAETELDFIFSLDLPSYKLKAILQTNAEKVYKIK